MTEVPIWAPFALLTAVCAVCPTPDWIRRLDWCRVLVWVLLPTMFWSVVGLIIWMVT